MDPNLLSNQAQAAVEALTAQLRSLETEQATLLHSLQLTTTTLSTLPSFTAIAPTLSAIPAYESKLARLKCVMAAQTREVEELKRRAREAGERRRRNLRRLEEGWRGERERDRTVLRARVVDEVARVKEEEEEDGGESVGESRIEGRGGGIKTVKRKKKARQVEIQ